MFGSSVLEVATGVVFVYLVLSLICTAINEAIATVINKRGKNLFEGVKNLLNDPNFTGLAQQIYSHGLVDGISKEAVNPAKVNRRPSYLPDKNFSLALLDVLSAHGVVAAAHGDALTKAEQAYTDYAEARRAAETKPDAQDANLPALKTAADEAQAALVDEKTKAETAYLTTVQTTLALAATPNDVAAAASEVQNAAATLDPTKLQTIAQAKAAFDKADATVKILNARIAAVDSAHDPKKAALIVQASDTLEKALMAGRTLAKEAPNQIANIQAAVNRLPDGHTKESLLVLIDKSKLEAVKVEDEIKHFQANVETWFNDSMHRVGGWYKRWTQGIQISLAVVIVLLLNVDTIMLIKRFSADKDLRAAVLKQAEKANQSQDEIEKQLDKLVLPIGWSSDPKDPRCLPFWMEGDTKRLVNLTFLKLIGLVISMFAVSLGAPFWFDTLSKFMNLRGAGTPPGEKKKSAGELSQQRS